MIDDIELVLQGYSPFHAYLVMLGTEEMSSF